MDQQSVICSTLWFNGKWMKFCVPKNEVLTQYETNRIQKITERKKSLNTWRALSMASGSFDLRRSWVMDSEPRHNVDNRLMVVETEAEDLLSGKNRKYKKHSTWKKVLLFSKIGHVCFTLSKLLPIIPLKPSYVCNIFHNVKTSLNIFYLELSLDTHFQVFAQTWCWGCSGSGCSTDSCCHSRPVSGAGKSVEQLFGKSVCCKRHWIDVLAYETVGQRRKALQSSVSHMRVVLVGQKTENEIRNTYTYHWQYWATLRQKYHLLQLTLKAYLKWFFHISLGQGFL